MVGSESFRAHSLASTPRSTVQHDAQRAERQDESGRATEGHRGPGRGAGRHSQGEGVGRHGLERPAQLPADLRQPGPGGGQPAGRQATVTSSPPKPSQARAGAST